jgi:anti-sigma B factor antagonist
MYAPDRQRATRHPDPCALRMRSYCHGGTHVIALQGDLDLITTAEVDRELRRVERTSANGIFVDLRGLEFIDSTGVRLLLQAERRSASGSNRLVVVRGPEQVQRVFDICGVTRTMPFVDAMPPPGAQHAATSRRVSQGALAGAIRELRTHR